MTIKLINEANIITEGYENVILSYIDDLDITRDSYFKNGILYVDAHAVDSVIRALLNYDNISSMPSVEVAGSEYNIQEQVKLSETLEATRNISLGWTKVDSKGYIYYVIQYENGRNVFPASLHAGLSQKIKSIVAQEIDRYYGI